MDSDHRDKLYREGKLTDTSYRRAGGVCGPDEIDNDDYQDNPGGYGPPDAGHLDAAANRKKFPSESVMGQQSLPGNTAASNARVRAASASEFNPDWYRQNTGASRN